MGEQTKTAEGWVLVPVEPTDAMLDAAARASMQHFIDCINSPDPAKQAEIGSEAMVRKTHASRYRTMVAAAPKAPPADPAQQATKGEWKFNALYGDTEVRSVADDKLLAVVCRSSEQRRIVSLLKGALAAQQAPVQPSTKVEREGLTDAEIEDAAIELFTTAQGASSIADKLVRIDEILRRLIGIPAPTVGEKGEGK